jgi:hypothetical protein
MNRRLLKSWLLRPAVVFLLACVPFSVKAAELIDATSAEGVPETASSAVVIEPNSSPALNGLPGTFSTIVTDINSSQTAGQVTSVSQLSDVQSMDWAFQALQSLVERYGCIAGYPNGTFRGNRAATRYELAAALNACLDQISDKFATKEDLETVKALQEEFKAQQFSTTTKLAGEVIFQAAEFFSTDGKKAVATGAPTTADNARPIFADRVRLNFDTSLTGKDRLRVRLQAGQSRKWNWRS